MLVLYCSEERYDLQLSFGCIRDIAVMNMANFCSDRATLEPTHGARMHDPTVRQCTSDRTRHLFPIF